MFSKKYLKMRVKHPEIMHHLEQHLNSSDLSTRKTVDIDRSNAEMLLLNFNTTLQFSEKKNMHSTSKIWRIEGGSIQPMQRKSAEDRSKWFEVLSNNKYDSLVLEWDFMNSRTRTASHIGKQLIELIRHLIPRVQQTSNSQPTRKHDCRSRSTRTPPIIVL